MMTIAVHDRFGTEPLAGDSAQFPLSRGSSTPVGGGTGPVAGLRPWNLRGMRELPDAGEREPMGTYDPVRQVRVDRTGRPLVVAVPNLAMSSITTLDGDGQGPGEDWKADFAPDSGV